MDDFHLTHPMTGACNEAIMLIAHKDPDGSQFNNGLYSKQNWCSIE